jgi:hypothetical protein
MNVMIVNTIRRKCILIGFAYAAHKDFSDTGDYTAKDFHAFVVITIRLLMH